MIESLNVVLRTSARLVQELGREPTPEEIAARADVPLERVEMLLKLAKEPVSLETPVGDEEESRLGDFVEDDRFPSPAEEVIGKDLQVRARDLLKTLTPREEKVIRMRFGLDEKTEHTLEEVGRDFSVTRERVRQIEGRALHKLRRASRSRNLKSFIEE
jgi:RNA polymerase primary sigma factor